MLLINVYNLQISVSEKGSVDELYSANGRRNGIRCIRAYSFSRSDLVSCCTVNLDLQEQGICLQTNLIIIIIIMITPLDPWAKLILYPNIFATYSRLGHVQADRRDGMNHRCRKQNELERFMKWFKWTTMFVSRDNLKAQAKIAVIIYLWAAHTSEGRFFLIDGKRDIHIFIILRKKPGKTQSWPNAKPRRRVDGVIWWLKPEATKPESASGRNTSKILTSSWFSCLSGFFSWIKMNL